MTAKVIFLDNGRAIRPAKGHMPFQGHRTQKEVTEYNESRRFMRQINAQQAREARG